MDAQAFFNRFHYNPETDNIGSGGFGAVYRAYDRTDERFRAIKIAQVREDKFSLRREVELTQEIPAHPHVASYIGCWRFNMAGTPLDYAVMPYYEHGSLEKVLRETMLRESDKFRILIGLLQGIVHLHRNDVIHRDLKPQNVLLDRQDGVWVSKIADFGMSRASGADSQISVSNSAVGYTPSFAAPEQLRNERIRKNVDLWAAGVIICRVFSGELPFEAPPGTPPEQRIGEISRRILHEPVPDRILAKIPEPWRTIAEACLVKKADERPQHAEMLLKLLPGSEVGLSQVSTNKSNGPTTNDQTQQYTRTQFNAPQPQKQPSPTPKTKTPARTPVKTKRPRSYGWLKWVFGLLVFVGLMGGALWWLEKEGIIHLTARPDAGVQMRHIVERYHKLNALHDESLADLFADRVERFYLQKNLSRKGVLAYSKDWWGQYPYETMEINWNEYKWARREGGYFCFYKAAYCKRKTLSARKDCQNMILTMEFDLSFKITALY